MALVGTVGGDGDTLPLGAPVLDSIQCHHGRALTQKKCPFDDMSLWRYGLMTLCSFYNIWLCESTPSYRDLEDIVEHGEGVPV